MAVTKKIPLERVLSVLQTRHIDLIGESRWQEAKTKLSSLPPDIEKHFIGHLQSNKVKEVVAAFDCIESVDSIKLAQTLNQAASASSKVMPVFIQVNVSNDAGKHGFKVSELEAAVRVVQQLAHLRLDGLMTITAKQDQNKTRADFRRMKQLQEQFGLRELSMGMSSDWAIATAEGATIVRLGAALFGERPTPA